MPLLTVVQDVCAVVGVQTPASVFVSIASNRTMAEMVALANEMAQRIATDTRDWNMLKLKATFTGDGVNEAFNLPANFLRLLTGAEVWRSTLALQPMRFIPDFNEWVSRRAVAYYDSRGEWTLYGGQIHIQPVMGAGVTAYTSYLDRNPITLGAGGVGERFVADNDAFRLPERILKLGMIWQWKANKGSPYAEDMGTWSDAMALAMGTDSPSPVLVDRLPISSAARIAYPFPVPSP